jgi:hypothetical protein
MMDIKHAKIVLLGLGALLGMYFVLGAVVWAAWFGCTSYQWMPACRVYCVRLPANGGPFAPCDPKQTF